MDYDAEVVKFLSKRENLLFAFEVSERLEQVKDKFQNEFWLEVRDAVERQLKRSEKTGRWTLEFPNESELHGWIYCNLYSTDVADDQKYLGVGLQQSGGPGNYHFDLGIWWNDSFNGRIKWQPVQKLADRLGEEGFEIANSTWLGMKHLDLVPRSKEFVLRMVAGKHILIDEMADLLWMLFESKRAMIQAANRALAKR